MFECSYYCKALLPADDKPEPVPARLQEILLLPNDTALKRHQFWRTTLWYRYRTSPHWRGLLGQHIR